MLKILTMFGSGWCKNVLEKYANYFGNEGMGMDESEVSKNLSIYFFQKLDWKYKKPYQKFFFSLLYDVI